jgi:hypothetical protein
MDGPSAIEWLSDGAASVGSLAGLTLPKAAIAADGAMRPVEGVPAALRARLEGLRRHTRGA